jgi:hypothetical protein
MGKAWESSKHIAASETWEYLTEKFFHFRLKKENIGNCKSTVTADEL